MLIKKKDKTYYICTVFFTRINRLRITCQYLSILSYTCLTGCKLINKSNKLGPMLK